MENGVRNVVEKITYVNGMSGSGLSAHSAKVTLCLRTAIFTLNGIHDHSQLVLKILRSCWIVIPDG